MTGKKEPSHIERSQYRRKATYRKRLMDKGLSKKEFGEGTPVAIYIRVSSDEQVGEGHHSLEAQETKCREFAKRKGWRVVEVYIDPGFSGKDDQRPAFQQMMRDARRGKFRSVLVHKLDRFMRNLELTSRYFKEMANIEVMLTSVTEDFDFSSPHGHVFFHMMAVFAEWYLLNLSSEAVKAKEQMARKGIHNGRLPFGYTKKEGKPVIVPHEAEAIKKAFELYSTSQYTDRQLAEYLREAGFKTRRGRIWSKDSIREMLRNEFYCGVVAHRDELFPGRHNAIITWELYNQVQEIRSKHAASTRSLSKAKRRNSPYLLQRIIRCGACGRPLRIQTTGTYHYYKEASPERGLQCECAGSSFRMEDKRNRGGKLVEKGADRQILELLTQIELPENWQEEVERRAEKLDVVSNIERRRGEIDEQLKRLGRAYADGAFSEEDYNARREVLLSERRTLIVPDNAEMIELGLRIESLGPYLAEATSDEKSAIVHLLLESVYTNLEFNKIEKIQPNPDFLEIFRMAAEREGWQEEDGGVFVVGEE